MRIMLHDWAKLLTNCLSYIFSLDNLLAMLAAYFLDVISKVFHYLRKSIVRSLRFRNSDHFVGLSFIVLPELFDSKYAL